MQILITGGTGFVGGHVARALLAQGHAVRIMGRNFDAVADVIAAGAEPLAVDLRDAAGVVEACAGVEAVYHVGAISAPWGSREDFFAVNVGGTQRVVTACRRQRVRRLIYVSSPSVIFAGRDQHEITETVPYPEQFLSIYSQTKKLGEDVVNAARSFVETVIIRPKAIFGPGDTTLLPRLINAAKQGRLPQIGDGQNRVDVTYIDNVVHALVLALSAPQAVGKTYHITNGEHVRLWHLIRTVLDHQGIGKPLREVPYAAAYAVATLLELRGRIGGAEPLLTRYIVAVLGRTQTYTITAAERDLGYTPLISVQAGIERTLAALQTT